MLLSASKFLCINCFYRFFLNSASTSIAHPIPKDASIPLPSVTTGTKPLTTDPSTSSVQPPASHYYSNYSKNQPSTQGTLKI